MQAAADVVLQARLLATEAESRRRPAREPGRQSSSALLSGASWLREKSSTGIGRRVRWARRAPLPGARDYLHLDISSTPRVEAGFHATNASVLPIKLRLKKY